MAVILSRPLCVNQSLKVAYHIYLLDTGITWEGLPVLSYHPTSLKFFNFSFLSLFQYVIFSQGRCKIHKPWELKKTTLFTSSEAAVLDGGPEMGLTHCGLVTPYGSIDLNHYWLR